MFKDVVNRLLSNAIKMSGRGPVPEDNGGRARKIAAKAAQRADMLGQLREPDPKGIRVVTDRDQAPGQEPRLGDRLPEHLAHPLKALGQFWKFPGRILLERRADKLDGCQLLAETVVQVLPDAAPLAFGDLNHLALHAAAFRLGLREGAVPLDHFERPPDDPGQQVEEPRVLHDVVEGALLHHLYRGLLVALAGDDQEGNRGRLLLEPAQGGPHLRCPSS